MILFKHFRHILLSNIFVAALMSHDKEASLLKLFIIQSLLEYKLQQNYQK